MVLANPATRSSPNRDDPANPEGSFERSAPWTLSTTTMRCSGGPPRLQSPHRVAAVAERRAFVAILDSLFTLHASRFTFHVSRFTFHVSRFTFHARRLTSQ